ncbi:hypothetical protein LB516_16195 [Mesorhizobium sp. CO1-1-7]|uniref:hypothetical protein n=1 Tax=Mesorhizobium sp. CO1-1-7 TaxID=2876632 RepID=UPI001CD11039|nr:hypothetical protein [Mesorhizobium sp. CO1-1-7]MBZ9746791.1 hypothetical protein [Mesorhizobium sp. CO1-1-7]
MKLRTVGIAIVFFSSIAGACAQDTSQTGPGQTAPKVDQQELVQCASLQQKMDKNVVLSNDEMQNLSKCDNLGPICAPGALCEAYVPKNYLHLSPFGDLSTNWNNLVSG